MKKISISVLLAFGLSSCSVHHARTYVGAMASRTTGEAGLSSASLSGGPLGGIHPDRPGLARADLDDSLGIAGFEGSPYVRTELNVGGLGVTLSAFQHDSSGEGTLDTAFGKIPAMTPIRSNLALSNVKGAVTFDFLDFELIRFSPGVALDLLDLEMSVSAPILGKEEEISTSVPVPLAFLQTEFNFGPVAATIDFGGMWIDVEEVSGLFIDVEVLLRVRPWDHVELMAGARWIMTDLEGINDGQNYSMDVDVMGFFLGIGVTF